VAPVMRMRLPARLPGSTLPFVLSALYRPVDYRGCPEVANGPMMPPGMARLALVHRGHRLHGPAPDTRSHRGGWEVRASAAGEARLAATRSGLRGGRLAAEPAPRGPLRRGRRRLHLAGATSSLSSTEEMHESNVVATTNLVGAARATGVGGSCTWGRLDLREEVPLPSPCSSRRAASEPGYGKAKWLAEERVGAVADACPPWCCVRSRCSAPGP